MDAKLALKVDVDTLKGYIEGVPRLLKIFADRNIKATFLFSFGPDNSGKAIRRIFRKGFLKKMLRTKAPSTYGLKTMMYGTLLPAPMIVEPNPAQFVSALECGHDCGIHAWDHVKWQDCLNGLSQEELYEDYMKAVKIFEKYAGRTPLCCGAPGWQVSEASLAMQDTLNFKYCSDTRGNAGSYPFLPKKNGHIFHTLQIPSTFPTLDELLGENGITSDNVNDYYIGIMQDGLNVHTIHTEMEGGALADTFEKFVDICLEKGVSFITLNDAADEANKSLLPTCEVTDGYIPGRAGKVAVPGISCEI